MRAILHIRTRPEDPTAEAIIRQHATRGDYQVEVVDLTLPDPDYGRLVESILSADSVQVW